jgi:prepilin-type N-terminal cleavage/methylation domain-containing protein
MSEVNGIIMKSLMSSRGFTLLEVVISVAIIATGFFAVYSLHIQTLAAAEDVRFYIKAPLLAQTRLAEAEGSVKDMADGSGDFGEDYEGYTWKMKVGDVTNEILGTTSEKMKKIELQIILNEGENTYDITAYRYAEPTDK